MTTSMAGPPAKQTDSNPADVEAALLAAGLPLAALRIVAAQSALETNGWKGGLWNWNLGNVTTAGPNFVLQPKNSLHFATYGSLAEGARGMVDLLRSHLYPGAIELATIGDLAGYVAVLKKGGYAGAAIENGGKTDYGAYEAGIARWMTHLAPT